MVGTRTGVGLEPFRVGLRQFLLNVGDAGATLSGVGKRTVEEEASPACVASEVNGRNGSRVSG